MNKLIQLVSILIALVAGVVAIVGYLQFDSGRGSEQSAVFMTLFGFVVMTAGITIWMVARAAAWWKRS